MSLLVPQLEQMVRLRLKAQDVHTLYTAENGVETEKALGPLLDMPEGTAFLGEDLSFELRSVLLEQVGPNLRNEIAHGLVTDASMWGAASVYAWWLCLHMVLSPYLLEETREESREATGEQTGQEAADDVDDEVGEATGDSAKESRSTTTGQ